MHPKLILICLPYFGHCVDTESNQLTNKKINKMRNWRLIARNIFWNSTSNSSFHVNNNLQQFLMPE